MANFFNFLGQYNPDGKKKKDKIKGKAKIAMRWAMLHIGFKIMIVMAVGIFISSGFYLISHWVSDYVNDYNNPSVIYDMIGSETKHLFDLVTIAGNEEDGYYIAFKDGADERIDEIVEKYASADFQSIVEKQYGKEAPTPKKELLLKLIKAELVSQYPNLGGKIGNESNIELLQDSEEKYQRRDYGYPADLSNKKRLWITCIYCNGTFIFNRGNSN